MTTIAEFFVGPKRGGMSVEIKVWAAVHVFSVFTSGTLFVSVAEKAESWQHVIDGNTSVTLFVALGFAAMAFVAGMRLQRMFDGQQHGRREDRERIMDSVRRVEQRVSRMEHDAEGRSA